MRYLLAIVVLLSGCGGGGGGDGDDADGGGDGDGGGSSDANGDGGSDSCAVACSAATCGTAPATATCGAVVCDRCRFTSDSVESTYTDAVALVAGSALVVGYKSVVTTRGAGGSTATLPAYNVVDLAVANGTTWALLDSGGGDLSLAFSSSGSWTVESIFDTRERGRLAVASDGTVHVAYGGGGATTAVPMGLVHARRSAAGQWTYQTVVAIPTNVPEFVDITLVNGEPWILWADRNAGSLKLSMASGGTFTTETVDDNLPVIAEHPLSIAIDGQGRAHAAYRQDSPFLREIHYAVRNTGGGWSREVASVLRNGVRGDVRIALSSTGAIAIAYLDSQGIGLASRVGGRWFVQPLAFDGIAVDLAFDAAGAMHVAMATRPSEVRVFTRAGTYPSDYDATCDQIAQTLCPLACGCGSDCCISGPSTNGCQSPLGFCEYAIDWQVCADASQDPQVAYDCHAAASTATCGGDATLDAPAACTQF